jgi:hypothetical protein
LKKSNPSPATIKNPKAVANWVINNLRAKLAEAMLASENEKH